MKPTDKALDEALQRALRQKFDTFEAEPSRSLSERVLGLLKSLPHDTTYRFPVLVLVLLSLGIGGWVAGNLWASEKVRTPAPAFTGANHLMPAATHKPQSVANRPAATQSLRQPFTKLIDTPPSTAPVLLPSTSEGAPTAQPDLYTTQAQESAGPVMIRTSKLIPRPYISPAPPARPAIKGITPTAANQPSAARPFPLRGVLSFSPTNTFQRLTVLPQADVRFQNFRLPSSLSPQTMGYSLGAGVESRGFQLLFHYSRFQQDISYEIGSNVYIIEPQPAHSPLITRKGIVQHERLTFQLVGVALHKKHSLRSSLVRDAFIDTGASLSHDLTTSQNLAWGTVGVGKSWSVAPHTRLAVTPHVQFSLNNLRTNNDAFKSRYFQVGLNFELSFGME
jgi:hypothetical protein